MGYVPDYTVVSHGAYGAEIATKNLTEALTRYFDVYVFGIGYEDKVVNGVNFKDSHNLEEFALKNEVEAMIVSRYVFYLLEFDPVKIAKKTFFWLHDIFLSHYYNNRELPNMGIDLLVENSHKINGFVTLTNWHKKELLKEYEHVDEKDVFVIGNALNIEDFEVEVDKDKSRFVWFQYPSRGLFDLINFFPRIKQQIPDATLYIYGGEEYFKEQNIDIEDYLTDYMFYKGKLDNTELIKEIKKASYWVYPLNFYETYCIAALEAQLAGLMCIATNSSGLKETLGDRGILINRGIDYFDDFLDAIVKVHNDDYLRREYIKKAKSFAKRQTWQRRAHEWKQLIERA